MDVSRLHPIPTALLPDGSVYTDRRTPSHCLILAPAAARRSARGSGTAGRVAKRGSGGSGAGGATTRTGQDGSVGHWTGIDLVGTWSVGVAGCSGPAFHDSKATAATAAKHTNTGLMMY